MKEEKTTRRTFVGWLLGLFPLNYLARFIALDRLGTLLEARTVPKVETMFSAEHEAAEHETALKFLIIGDWGRQGQVDQISVARQMAKTARQRKCKFVISVGDNFYENGVQTAEDPQWQTSFENVYRDLPLPWYAILGNHDYRGKPEAQLEYANSHPNWRMPARYYSLTQTLANDSVAQFFFVDTSPFILIYHFDSEMLGEIFSQNTAAQLRWLDAALGSSRADWKIVVGHHPVYSGGEHRSQPEMIQALKPLLEKHSVPVYISGHDHDLQHIKRGSINYFISGAGSLTRQEGRIRGTRFAQGLPGFMAVSLTPGEMRIDVIDQHGMILYGFTVANPALVPT